MVLGLISSKILNHSSDVANSLTSTMDLGEILVMTLICSDKPLLVHCSSLYFKITILFSSKALYLSKSSKKLTSSYKEA
ncbi:Uncharacterised protein [Chlamydia trachomatis]|nr:Uncharacterised protein [Chlamydia trachomatis]